MTTEKILVGALHYGDTVEFTNGETAIVNTVDVSHFHNDCWDIEFDREVTGYISGRRGGEKRKIWCYEDSGNFANYHGKQNCIVGIVSKFDYGDDEAPTTTGYLIEGLEDELRNSGDADKAFSDAVRLFSLAMGMAKEKSGSKVVENSDELRQLCDATDDYDFWYPCKFKNEPWKPMRAMMGVCAPYRFRSQETCMKAIAALGNEKMNQIFGLKD